MFTAWAVTVTLMDFTHSDGAAPVIATLDVTRSPFQRSTPGMLDWCRASGIHAAYREASRAAWPTCCHDQNQMPNWMIPKSNVKRTVAK